jgi:hypothetical protein
LKPDQSHLQPTEAAGKSPDCCQQLPAARVIQKTFLCAHSVTRTSISNACEVCTASYLSSAQSVHVCSPQCHAGGESSNNKHCRLCRNPKLFAHTHARMRFGGLICIGKNLYSTFRGIIHIFAKKLGLL